MYRIGEEELDELRKVIESKVLFRRGNPEKGHQQAVVRFEREWAEKIGTQHTLCLSGGGTAALICALAALEIGPGDEVIVPAYTWLATASAVLSVGAIPVLAEVNETLMLDPEDVERKLSPNVRAIIPVHMAGRIADLEPLLEICQQHDLEMVEDACQADGGSYKGRRVGSWGNCGAFSFNDFKIISCGEGGAMVTNDKNLYERAVIFHDSLSVFPKVGEDISAEPFLGLQYRASEVMGAILLAQMRRLDGILDDLRRVQKRVEQELGDEPNLRVAPKNETEGDCGVVTAFQFDEPETARAFATASGGSLPIDSGRHVYTNWDMLLEKRAGHHPAMNPFNLRENQNLRTEYSRDACPRTLDILHRTVYLSNNPDWSEDEISQRIEKYRQAARAL